MKENIKAIRKAASRARKYCFAPLASAVLFLPAVLAVLPVVFTFAASFLSYGEFTARYIENEGFVTFLWIPYFVSLEQYARVLFYSDIFLRLFWRHVFMVSVILASLAAVSAPAAFCLVHGSFKGRRVILFLYIITALLPFQVTLVPNFLILSRLKLLNSQAALIAPAAFSPFGVFLLCQQMKHIPPDIMNAAKIDGANLFNQFWRVFLPLAKPAMAGVIILCFFENWNITEQPLVFIFDGTKYPLSLYLRIIQASDPSALPAAAALFMVLPLLVFAFADKHLTNAIELTVLK